MSFGVIEKHQPITSGWIVQKRELTDMDWKPASPVVKSEGLAEMILEEISYQEWMNRPDPWKSFPQYRLTERINFPIQV